MVWGTTVDVNQAVQQFRDFIERFVDERTGSPKYPALLSEIRTASGSALGLDCRDLHSWAPDLYKQMITYPQEIVPAFDIVVNDLLDLLG